MAVPIIAAEIAFVQMAVATIVVFIIKSISPPKVAVLVAADQGCDHCDDRKDRGDD